jgi:hypothetical protein
VDLALVPKEGVFGLASGFFQGYVGRMTLTALIELNSKRLMMGTERSLLLRWSSGNIKQAVACECLMLPAFLLFNLLTHLPSM